MAKETAQSLGIEGVTEIKEWLEATTRFAFTYTAYDSEAMCTVTCLNGENKLLDLEGSTTKDPKKPVSVECKKYTTVGHQGAEFRRFLAIAYSSTAKKIAEVGVDWERDFMWVTFHPFSQTNWKKLLTVAHLRACLEKNKDLLDDKPIDDDLLAKIAARIWVMVVEKKQVEIRLTKQELALANAALISGGK